MSGRAILGSVLAMLLVGTAPLTGCARKTAISSVQNDWTIQYTVPQKRSLSGIWGTSAKNVFVVGVAGTILHYDGKAWSAMDSGTSSSLDAVWGSSPNDVFAVGTISGLFPGQGIIVRYDGRRWSTMDVSVPPLNAIWGSSSSDVYAAGHSSDNTNSGSILHYDGKSWSYVISDLDFVPRGIWGDSASDVYVVGDDANVLHYDGNAWHSMNLSSFVSSQIGTQIQFNGIWGTSQSDVYIIGSAVSETTFDASFFLLHYDGQYWDHMPGIYDQFYNVWGSSSSDVFIAGIEKQSQIAMYYYGVIQHYYGDSWSRQAVPNSHGNVNDVVNITVDGIWGSSSSDVFAVDSIGDILHYTGR